MATTIAKASLQLSANATEVMTELEKVTKKSKSLEGAVKGIPEVGEKAKASLNQISQVSNVFSVMSSDVNILEKSVTGVSGAVSTMTVGLQLATKVTGGLKAALLGTGIGAIVVAIGFILSKIAAAKSAAEATTPARLAYTGPRDFSVGIGAGDLVKTSESAMRGGDSDAAKAMREAMDARGRMRDAARFGESIGMGTLAEAESGPRMMALSRSIEAATVAMERLGRASSVTGITGIGESARRATETMGMSSDEAARYSLTLRTVKEDVGGVMVSVTRSITPTEHLNSTLARLEADRARGAISTDTYRRAVEEAVKTHEAEERALSKARTELDLLAEARRLDALHARGATITDSVRTPIERAREAMAELNDVWNEGGITTETWERSAARIMGDLERSGALELSAPAALLEGSAAATSAINAARRMGSSDPAARTIAAIDHHRRVDEAMALDARRIAEALTGGIIRL
jgi:hypothetical protein